ncbi:MAG TPA: hypothetical protein VN783_10145 [Thermoanaerobaculia bacterium]|nr:hypothetical protein [Thermoanaerobaculia bacterium]
MSQGPSTVIVATLLGHAQVDLGLACLGSLLAHSADPLHFRLHDDGSLTAADRERLAGALGGPTFVLRPEADERAAEILAGRPALAAYRRESPLCSKLVDAVLFAEGGELAYCDSDVLFLRPFSGLFRFPSPAASACFMRDTQHAYSVRSWHLLREPRLRFPGRVNTGIIHARTRCFDPDLLEWFLSRSEYRFAPPWVEQTCWALLAGKGACWLHDPRQIAFPRAGRLDPETVALHFVSPLRGRFTEFRHPPDRRSEPPVPIRSAPASPCGPLNLAATEIRRRLRRVF